LLTVDSSNFTTEFDLKFPLALMLKPKPKQDQKLNNRQATKRHSEEPLSDR